MSELQIGVFDSGLGGLTAVRELIRILPGENLVYFGDTARVPYGTRSEEMIRTFAKQDLRFLLDKNVKALIEVLKENPFQNPPPYEKLVGDLQGAFSRRINIKHRLIYQVYEEEKTVKILSMWTHYEK